MIELHRLTFRYPGTDHDALHDVSLTIGNGEFVAVMGANGSGKSTLVRCLNGLITPTGGMVSIDGWRTDDPSRLRQIRERLGIVFQNPHLQITSLTVEREVAFGLQNVGLPMELIGQRVEEHLHAAGLADDRRRPPGSLSGGEQQRLALAAILAMKPMHIVLDEATSLLSPSSRKAVLERVGEERKQRRMTVVLVTQFVTEAATAGRLVILHKGEVVCDAPPREALAIAAATLGNLRPSVHIPPDHP
jgi:energy-coupling factor transporter ATP-binding protein EcfA2